MGLHGRKWGCRLTWRMMIGKGEDIRDAHNSSPTITLKKVYQTALPENV